MEPNPSEKAEMQLFRAWKWTLLAAPIFWCLGLNLFIYHLLAYYLVFKTLMIKHQTQTPLYVPPSALVLFILVVIYTCSLAIHGAQYPFTRVVASLYNLSYWVMGICLIVYIANHYQSSILPTIFSPYKFLIILSGLAAIGMIILGLQGQRMVYLQTPLSFFINESEVPMLVRQTLEARWVTSDWIGGKSWARFNFLSPYPTATGAMVALMLIGFISHARIAAKGFSASTLMIIVLGVTAMCATLSRTLIIAFLASFVFAFILQKKQSVFWGVLFLIMLVLAFPALEALMNQLIGMRSHSNVVRLEIYSLTLDQLKGVDWLIGIGLKPRFYDLSMPVGSHSTYLSLLLKSGVLGGLLFISLQIYLISSWYRLKKIAIVERKHKIFWEGLGQAIAFIAIFILTEDLDAPQFLAFIYFSMIGFLEGLRRTLLYESVVSPGK